MSYDPQRRARFAKQKLYRQIMKDLDKHGLQSEKEQYFNIRIDDVTDKYVIAEQPDSLIEYLESAVPLPLPQGYHVYDFDGYILGIKVISSGKIEVTPNINFAQIQSIQRILPQKPKPLLTQISNHENPILSVYGAAIIFEEKRSDDSHDLYFLQETADEIWFYSIMNLTVGELYDETPRTNPKPLATQRLEVFQKKYLIKYAT